MQTALALDCPVPADPVFTAATRLAEMLEVDIPIDARLLRCLFESATRSSDASAGWSIHDAYRALELAQVLYLTSPTCPIGLGSPAAALSSLQALAARLPTQSYRSEDQLDLQQFSTPIPVAWLAGMAAMFRPQDFVLEPSAGTGLLVWPAARTGSRLTLNEIDVRRRACLETAFPTASITGHDAEILDDLLPASLSADVVMMNPPFARSHGRGDDRHAAVRHLDAAWKRLRTGGRLVAIMPDRFSARGWTDSRPKEATLRLDARLAAGLYAKQGTGIAVRLIVIDKLVDTVAPCDVETNDLCALLEPISRIPARSAAPPIPAPAPPRLSLFGDRHRGRPALAPTPVRSQSADLAEALDLAILEDPAPVGDQVGIYLPWRPSRLNIPDACEHPTPLVESIAMGSVAAPKPTYLPCLPRRLVTDGVLSSAQLETLVYAGDAFERDTPGRFVATDEGCTLKPDADGTAYAGGFFLGDGTGAGKGRQIAGIILDQWLRGRRRHIWLSKNETLLEDARRDWSALGGLALDIQPLSRWKLGAPLALDAGILFVTYPTLRSGRDDATRLRQIVEWAGTDYDGVIAFDEAHAMANAAGETGSRGKVKGSEQGIAGLRLQNLLPRARVLYASATGASDVANLSYATRLGLWGPGTAFADREQFVGAIRKGGIAAMELVARDLKALGLYTARALSFAGVEYDLLEHALSDVQIGIYDAYAEAWAIIHRNLSAVLEETRVVDAVSGATLNANAKSAALSRFEGTKQRFFAQLLLSMKLPSLIPAIEADIENDHAVVVQLVSTAEAMLDRRLADLTPDEREALEIDLYPREYVVDYLTTAFPTRQMKVFTDAEGTVRSEPMSDDEGRPVHCRSAMLARDTLIEQLCALPPIATALDALIERFGTEAVAEVTGRTRRLVIGNDGRQRIENRTPRSNLIEAQAFMDGTKQVLVFSDAGGTGRSYHASLDAKNQARRIHYLLEPGWRADAAIQGLGRTHRTRQASAPLFRPVTTNVRGERRFISTIARRLDALGALTRGQRQTGGQNLFDPADNLESDYAKDALMTWYRLLFDGKLRSATLGDFQDRTGLRLESEDGGLREDLPPIQRWLNRLLALPIALQNAIFDEYLALIEARVSAARDAGTLDIGVETLLVDRFDIAEDRVIRTDTVSGATTHLLRLEISRRLKPMTIERVSALRTPQNDAQPLINQKSGMVALRLNARSLMTSDGEPVQRYQLLRPTRSDYLARDLFEETNWRPVDEARFAILWAKEVGEALATPCRETLHLATGLLLPIWDKLPDDHVQVLRVADPAGRSLLGREIPPSSLAALGTRLGLELDAGLSPNEVVASVLKTGRPLRVSGPGVLELKRSLVNGSQRLELTAFEPARLAEYKAHGCFTEIIRYQTRLFVPVDSAAEVIARIASGAA
ncbi:methyltransferase [Sphingomonas sp. ID1715]|uniref:strawberry notch family protein n=1 Tax=Sphingomonas sp. ID1715 TaxID=1656898 RepID=UPI001487FC61|nr:strawberry notch family protein [Sphingomonas sp. ID1715]NNM78056.1 methyltransferase [Sphingomonas sp. ID1715]